MKVNNSDFKLLTSTINPPFDSRFSVPPPDCEGLEEQGEPNNIIPLICFMNQQMAKHEGCDPMLRHDEEENDGFMSEKMDETEECDVLTVGTTKANDENSVFEGQQTDKPEQCDVKLPPHAREEFDEKSSSISQQMTRNKRFDTKLLSQHKRVENDENSCLTGEQIANPEECDTESFKCTREENGEKRGSTGQGIQHIPLSEKKVIYQIAQNDECVSKLPQHKKGENDEKNRFVSKQMAESGDCDIYPPQFTGEEIDVRTESITCYHKREKYFCYDPPLSEETGVWIPVSVPPMSESEHEEWTRGFCPNGGIFPEEDMGWSQFFGEDKELTMWDVFVEMLLAARGKVSSFSSGDVCKMAWISSHVVEQAWKEMAQTLTEANSGNIQEILEAEPPKWLPDSAASACMLCSVRFHPIMCGRHHCRFCGGIFCSECTRGRRLLPARFRVGDPERVCDVCCVRLESVQPYLMDQVSRAAQLPTHDLTDLSTLRSWLNFPWGQSMEYEIYKCANTIRGYNKVGSLRPEKSIPAAILRQAKGLAILTVMKVGMMVTYNIGTGLVIARREDGSWSPPSAISSFGAGWGPQAGGELTDLIIVLRSKDAVRTFSGDMHLSIGAGLSAAVGIVGRTAEADVRAATSGYAACYTYSCSKGAFIGCSLEGSVVTTRAQENSRFYGSQSLNAPDILLGSLPRPPAAAVLYRALADLYQKLDL